MTDIETLDHSSLIETSSDLAEYFTPPTLHIQEGDISLTKETIVPTLEKLLDRDKRVLLLGEPGSGKSTLLREVLQEYQTSGSSNYDTVMYLPLRAFEESGDQSFLDFFQKKILTGNTKLGNLLWVLDGMDEVKDPGRMASLIGEITALRPEDNIIIATRPIVSEEGFLGEYTPVTILPFTINQVLSFAERYCRQSYGDNYRIPLPLYTTDNQPVTLKMEAEHIIRSAFNDNLLIKNLLSSPVALPYILDMMAAGYIGFPLERMPLYRDIIDYADDKIWSMKDPYSFASVLAPPEWESKRSVYDTEMEFLESVVGETKLRLRMINFYKYIAVHMMTDFGQPVISRNDMKNVLIGCFSEVYAQNVMGVETLPIDFCEQRAEGFLQAAEKGLPLVTKLEEDGFGFAHRSLYEFLVAQDIISHAHKANCAEWAISFCKDNNLLFSLHGRESIRMFLEILAHNGNDNDMEQFFRLVLYDTSTQPYESVLTASSFVTRDICSSWYCVLIKEIYSALENAIIDLKDSGNPDDQIILYRLRKQQERLYKIIKEKGIGYILSEELE